MRSALLSGPTPGSNLRPVQFALVCIVLFVSAATAAAQALTPRTYWPAPDGPFYMVMRLYGPEAEALEGLWTPPPAMRID